MLRLSAVEPRTLELLRSILNEPFASDFNLVGGTALALQTGHRKSIDLDLFGEPEPDPDAIFHALSHLGTTKLNFKARNTLGLFIDDIKVDIIRYGFPLTRPVTHCKFGQLLY